MTDETTGSVTSADGTTIGYRRFGGDGRPGVLLVHGIMSSSWNHTELARALATEFTVYLPDRRGRGASGPQGPDHGMAREVEDVAALLAATGARDVVGVSLGASIALEAARTLPAVHRLAVHEPPLFADPAEPAAVLRRVDRELARGRVTGALVEAMKGAQMGPAMFAYLPRWLLRRLTAAFAAGEERKSTDGHPTMRALAPTLPHDLGLVVESSGPQAHHASTSCEVLLVGGGRSPAYFRAALEALAAALPNARRIELPGLDHAASWNAGIGGRPEALAQEFLRFLA